MPANRYYTPQDLYPNTTMALEADEALHLKTVMRSVAGDAVELINGRGDLACALITEVNKKGVTLCIEAVTHTPPPRPLILGIGILVQDRLDLLLEKGTELGLTHIDLIKTALVGKAGFTDGQKERMQRVLVAALKQSGRLWLPTIGYIDSLHTFLSPTHTIYYGAINPTAPPFLKAFKSHHPFKLLIGPAKGFSPEELDILKNYTGVYLSDAILRAETAAIAMITLANHAFLY
ncbi:MAG: RsmE family RNA methyltransferase [Chlamydiia bacterium]